MEITQWPSTLAVPVSAKRDHIRGSKDAEIVLLEYGDYQCPYCAAAHAIVTSVREQMGDNLQFVFRHFPLTNVHPLAEPAAEAAEAAAAQGRFWDMHDTLYENQANLAPETLLEFADQIGLDTDQMADELQRGVHASKVHDDLLSGVRSGVRGTPAFFINGRRYDGSWSLPQLLGALNVAAAERNPV